MYDDVFCKLQPFSLFVTQEGVEHESLNIPAFIML